MATTKLSGDRQFRFDYLKKLFSRRNRASLSAYLDDTLRGPLVVDFDPTTACNFSCPECISADLLNKERIPAERITGLMEEFARAGVQGIVFIGGGEPLAHSCMPAPLRQAYELGMAVGLTTNGSLLDRYLDTIAECVSWTRVSMDAGTERTFLTFRPNKIPHAFHMILAAMRRLAAVKRGALGYSFLIMARQVGEDVITNAHELYEAARIAKDIGCDYFEYKPMFDMRHFLIPFSETVRTTVLEQHHRCLELRDDTFDVVAPKSVGQILQSPDPAQPKAYHRCPTMELRTTVTPSGIYPCAYHRGRQDLKLGTVYDGPFDEWWASEGRQRAAGRTDPERDCRFFCARHSTNLVLNAVESLHETGIDLLDYLADDDVGDVFF